MDKQEISHPHRSQIIYPIFLLCEWWRFSACDCQRPVSLKRRPSEMVGLIIPGSKACYFLARLRFGYLGWVSGSISIPHMPKHMRGPGMVPNLWDSRSLFRIAVMEIARLMKRKQKRRSDFTGWRFCFTTFMMAMFLVVSIVYVDILVLGSCVLCSLHIIHFVCYIHILIYIFVDLFIISTCHTSNMYFYDLYVLNLSSRRKQNSGPDDWNTGGSLILKTLCFYVCVCMFCFPQLLLFVGLVLFLSYECQTGSHIILVGLSPFRQSIAVNEGWQESPIKNTDYQLSSTAMSQIEMFRLQVVFYVRPSLGNTPNGTDIFELG